MKKVISFSGGETSALMAALCQYYWKDDDLLYVFANTGEEREETLEFIQKCDEHFGFGVKWIEADFTIEGKIGYNEVQFQTASRNGEPFEEFIKRHGIPNMTYPSCTGRLKTIPISHFAKDQGYLVDKMVIGIRVDELDRCGKYIYPLVNQWPLTKYQVNMFWHSFETGSKEFYPFLPKYLLPFLDNKGGFRLNLTSYQGNCKRCWKKSARKLFTIMMEENYTQSNFGQWEKRYSKHHPETQRARIYPITFFREHRSELNLIELAKNTTWEKSKDVNRTYFPDKDLWQMKIDFENEMIGIDHQLDCGDSCEPF